MHGVSRSKLALAAVIFTALAVLYRLNYTAAVLSMDLLFPIAPGISYWKSGLLLAWIAALLWFLAFSPRISTAPVRLLVLLIVFVQSVNLFMQFWFCSEYGIELGEYATFVDSGALSTTELTHTHVMKAVIAQVLQLFGISEVFGSDSGAPFLSLFPAALNWLMLFFITAVFILLLGALNAAFGRVPRGAAAVWLFCSLPASYAVFKSLIDGGPVALEFIIGSLVLARALTVPQEPLLPFPMVFVLVLAALAVESLASPDIESVSLIPRILFLLVAIPGLVDYARRKNLYSLCKSFFVCALAAKALAEGYLDGQYEASRTPLPAGTQVYVTTQIPLSSPYEALMSEPPYTVYRAVAGEGATLGDYFRAARTSPKYAQVLADGVSCDKTWPRFIAGEIMTSERPELPARLDSKIFPEFYVTPCESGERCAYRYSGKMHDCVCRPAAKPVVSQHLVNAGFKKFVLVHAAF